MRPTATAGAPRGGRAGVHGATGPAERPAGGAAKPRPAPRQSTDIRLDVAQAATRIRAFLARTPSPWLWEDGRLLGRLEGHGAGFSLSEEAQRLVCHFWTPTLNLVRRIAAWEEKPAQVQLHCLRLGQAKPTRLVLTGGASSAVPAHIVAARAEFREAAIAAAQRDWAGWRLAGQPGTLRTPLARLIFQRQESVLACVAVPEAGPAALDAALAQALLLADHVQKTRPQSILAGVRIIIPSTMTAIPAQLSARLRCLRTDVPIRCYALDRSAGWLEPLPPAAEDGKADLIRAPDLSPESAPASALRLLEEIREICPQTTLEPGPQGWRFRLYGLEIARQSHAGEAEFSFGYGAEQSPLSRGNRALFERFLRELGDQRVADANPGQPWFALQPERWMEHLLRSDLTTLDPVCDPRFLYAQVPLCGEGRRDLLDLLGIDRHGRLLVIELKAAEDVNFPLQALDYWARVRRHHQAGDFTRLGYFCGHTISPEIPRLWLVSPALRRHPRCDAILKWLPTGLPWSWLGLNEHWRSRIQVVYRKDAPHA